MKVYVLTEGDYSSYHILYVTLDKEKAERMKALCYKSSIETYDTDVTDLYLDGYRTWEFVVNEDGVIDVEFPLWFSDEYIVPRVEAFKRLVRNVPERCTRVFVSTNKGLEHARKIAYDEWRKNTAERLRL